MDFVELNAGLGSLTVTENDVLSASTEIFAPPEKEVSMVMGRNTVLKPLNKSDSGPFEFDIQGKTGQYLQLSSLRLHIKLRVLKADGKDLLDADKIALCNLPGGSLFSQIEIEINGKPVPSLTNTHAAYKQYLETICSYGFNARKSHLECSGFEMDTPHKFTDFAANGVNLGHNTRRLLIEKSRVFDLCFPIQSDFLQSSRLLPPMTRLGIKLQRNSDLFLLQGVTGDYKITIDEIDLHFRHITLRHSIYNAQMNRWGKEMARYPISRTDIRNFSFAEGLSLISIPNLITGALPKHLLIGLVNSSDYHPKITGNPYNFSHNNFDRACVRYNGEQIPNPQWCWTSGWRRRLTQHPQVIRLILRR